jgi:hypothetical protein
LVEGLVVDVVHGVDVAIVVTSHLSKLSSSNGSSIVGGADASGSTSLMILPMSDADHNCANLSVASWILLNELAKSFTCPYVSSGSFG